MRCWNLLSNLNDLYIYCLTLFVNNFQIVFMNLQDKSSIFVTVVVDELVGSKSIAGSWCSCESGCQRLIGITFELEVVCEDLDFLLALIKDHIHEFAFYVNNLTGFSLVFGLSDSYKITWLEILGHKLDVDL